jgi:hypothetical protein
VVLAVPVAEGLAALEERHGGRGAPWTHVEGARVWRADWGQEAMEARVWWVVDGRGTRDESGG